MNSELQNLLHDHGQLTMAYAKALLGHDAQILHLLQADLLHRRLMHNLLEAGLDAGDFHLELHTALFSMLGLAPTLEDEDALLDRYTALLQPYMQWPLKDFLGKLPEIANELLLKLKMKN